MQVPRYILSDPFLLVRLRSRQKLTIYHEHMYLNLIRGHFERQFFYYPGTRSGLGTMITPNVCCLHRHKGGIVAVHQPAMNEYL